MKVKSYYYYRTRSRVRFIFWSLISLAFVLMLSNSIESINDYSCDTSQVTVNFRDTLWSIAENNCDGNIREAVSDLVNLRQTDILRVGEIIQLTSNN